MTNRQRLGALILIWLAFAVGSSLIFTASLASLGWTPMKAVQFLNLVLLLGTVLSIFTVRHL